MDRTCGGCRFFRVTEQRDDSPIGECRLGKIIGVFRDTMHGCAAFARPGETPRVDAPARRRTPTRPPGGGRGLAAVEVDALNLETALRGAGSEGAKEALLDAIAAAATQPTTDLGRAWDGGLMMLCPADEALKPKELPLEQFMHKAVLIRDNLRVLEQKINGHHQLTDGERLDLHRRLTQVQTALLRFSNGWIEAAVPTRPGLAGLLDLLVEEATWSTVAQAVAPLGERWQGGRVRYSNGESTLDEPIERFYRRLMVLRDRLGDLEVRLARHPHIGEGEGDAMAGYIRRAYGSLTSFNVLFRERDDYFASGR